MFDALLRRMEFHPLAAAEFRVAREVLRRDDRFRLSHLGPLAFSWVMTRRRRPWIDKTLATTAQVPDDWHRRVPPIIVLGFWRSGTTLLHELLVADPAFVAPSLIDVLCPADAPYLLKWKRELVGSFAPLTRGIDKVDVAPNTPQEEELALCNLGAPSFFGVSFFPLTRAEGVDEALFFEGAPGARERWSAAHMQFSRTLVAKYPRRRLVLKNPANCTRIPELLALYPQALFIRIDRPTDQVISSFLRMQAQGDRKFSFQGRSPAPKREDALRFHSRVIDKLDADWDLIPDGRKSRVRYESLVRDPVGTVAAVYCELGITLTHEALRRRNRYWSKRGSRRTPANSAPEEPDEPSPVE